MVRINRFFPLRLCFSAEKAASFGSKQNGLRPGKPNFLRVSCRTRLAVGICFTHLQRMDSTNGNSRSFQQETVSSRSFSGNADCGFDPHPFSNAHHSDPTPGVPPKAQLVPSRTPLHFDLLERLPNTVFLKSDGIGRVPFLLPHR